MKRIPILLLACLLLSACGRGARESTPETSIESEATTEAMILTEHPFEPAEGENNGVTWRTLDVNAAEGLQARAWLADQHEQWVAGMNELQNEFPMGTKTLVREGETLVLRDSAGKETVLFKRTYIGEADTTEEALLDETAWKIPILAQVLDGRYFVYYWMGWEWTGDTAIYDTRNMRSIPIAWDEKYRLKDGSWRYAFSGPQVCGEGLYLVDSSYGPYSGALHLLRADLAALEELKSGQPLPTVDMLAGTFGGVKDADNANYRVVTPDERYFIMNDAAGLRIYDLQQKRRLLLLTPAELGTGAEEAFAYEGEIALRGNLVYWTDRTAGNGKYLVEITLP